MRALLSAWQMIFLCFFGREVSPLSPSGTPMITWLIVLSIVVLAAAYFHDAGSDGATKVWTVRKNSTARKRAERLRETARGAESEGSGMFSRELLALVVRKEKRRYRRQVCSAFVVSLLNGQKVRISAVMNS